MGVAQPRPTRKWSSVAQRRGAALHAIFSEGVPPSRRMGGADVNRASSNARADPARKWNERGTVNFEIRPIEYRDVDNVIKLTRRRNAPFQVQRSSLVTYARPKERTREFLRRMPFMVAVDGSELLGFVHAAPPTIPAAGGEVHLMRGPAAILQQVLTSVNGQGVGTALVARILDVTASFGYRIVAAQTSSEAVGFFTKAGWQASPPGGAWVWECSAGTVDEMDARRRGLPLPYPPVDILSGLQARTPTEIVIVSPEARGLARLVS